MAYTFVMNRFLSSVREWPRLPLLRPAHRQVQQPPLEAGRAPAPLPQLSVPLGGGRVLAAHPAPVLQTVWAGAVLLFCSAAVVRGSALLQELHCTGRADAVHGLGWVLSRL